MAKVREFDLAQANSEGWSLFNVDGRWQLGRLDDPANKAGVAYTPPRFSSYADALLFVAKCAVSGSKYHAKAISMVGTAAPPTDSDYITLLEVAIPHQFPIRLLRKGRKLRVEYGADVRDSNGPLESSSTFASAVFHALACAGLLDN